MRRAASSSKSKRTGVSERWRQVVAVVAAMAAGLSAGLFAAENIELAQPLTGPAIAPSDDEIYTGSILFVPDDGMICRQFLFDNRTGRLFYNGSVDCELRYGEDTTSGAAMPWSSMRTKIISEAFRNR
jgi:hypothetical protein